MKAHTVRLDAIYEVTFSRPAFEQMALFGRIIEPIYDAFCSDFLIDSDAIHLESGNTIANLRVTLTLLSGDIVFEARLDGYRAHFLNLRSLEAIQQAKKYISLFESVIYDFFTNAVPKRSRYLTPSWLTVEGGRMATETLVRSLTWLPKVDDPFQIGATKTSSVVKYACFNNDNKWQINITLDKSVLPEADLFLELSGEYELGTPFDSFDRLSEHLSTTSKSVIDKLNLTIQ